MSKSSIFKTTLILTSVVLSLSSFAAKRQGIGEEKKFMGTKEEFCYDVAGYAKILHEAAKEGATFEFVKTKVEENKLTNLYYKYNIANLYDAYGGYKSFSVEYFQQRAYLKCMSIPLIRSTWDLNN